MELNDEPGALALTIEGPDRSGPVIDELVASFSDRRGA